MDEDTRKFILELLIATRNVDWKTTLALTTVCKHLNPPATQYLWAMLQLRVEWSQRIAKAFYLRLIRQAANYTDVHITIHKPIDGNNQNGFHELYNPPFTPEFLRDNIIAISGITLWTRPVERMEYLITIMDYHLVCYMIKCDQSMHCDAIDAYAVKLKYPNRLNPIPLIEGKNGLNCVKLFLNEIQSRQISYMGMTAYAGRVEPLPVKKIIIEYVSMPKCNIDLSQCEVVYNNDVNKYITKHSLFVRSDDIKYVMEPPKTEYDEIIDYLQSNNFNNILNAFTATGQP